MLPDYPIIKNRIYNDIVLKRYHDIREATLGPLARVKVVRQFEGDRNADGGVSEALEYKEPESRLSIPSAELEKRSPQQLVKRFGSGILLATQRAIKIRRAGRQSGHSELAWSTNCDRLH